MIVFGDGVEGKDSATEAQGREGWTPAFAGHCWVSYTHRSTNPYNPPERLSAPPIYLYREGGRLIKAQK